MVRNCQSEKVALRFPVKMRNKGISQIPVITKINPSGDEVCNLATDDVKSVVTPNYSMSSQYIYPVLREDYGRLRFQEKWKQASLSL